MSCAALKDSKTRGDAPLSASGYLNAKIRVDLLSSLACRSADYRQCILPRLPGDQLATDGEIPVTVRARHVGLAYVRGAGTTR